MPSTYIQNHNEAFMMREIERLPREAARAGLDEVDAREVLREVADDMVAEGRMSRAARARVEDALHASLMQRFQQPL